METDDATNPGAEDARDEAPEVADETAEQAQDESTEGEGEESSEEAGDGQSDDDQPDDDAEDVELNGRTYRIPKAVLAERLMHADYTQKTQALSEIRTAVEARQQAAERLAEVAPALRDQHVRVEGLKVQVQQYSEINWSQALAEAAADQDNPTLAVANVMAAQAEFNTLKDQLREAEQGLTTKEQEFADQRQAAVAAAWKETDAVLASEIPNWANGAAQRAANAAQALGYGLDELSQLPDPKAWKAFHAYASMQAELAAAKAQLAKSKTTQRHAQSQTTTPAKTVTHKGGGFKQGLDDSLPEKVWLERRNAEIAARKRR